MKIQSSNVAYQFYLLPTIKVTNDKFLFGYYSIEVMWLKWVISIDWN
jgi:hypothetical protein